MSCHVCQQLHTPKTHCQPTVTDTTTVSVVYAHVVEKKKTHGHEVAVVKIRLGTLEIRK